MWQVQCIQCVLVRQGGPVSLDGGWVLMLMLMWAWPGEQAACLAQLNEFLSLSSCVDTPAFLSRWHALSGLLPHASWAAASAALMKLSYVASASSACMQLIMVIVTAEWLCSIEQQVDDPTADVCCPLYSTERIPQTAPTAGSSKSMA